MFSLRSCLTRFLLPGCAAAYLAAPVTATPVDPSRPIRLQVGESPGPAPFARFDPARSGVTSLDLPTTLGLAWRARVTGGLRGSAVVDQDGGVVVSTRGSALVELRPDGQTKWSARASATLSTGPALLADGTRIAQTVQGTLLAVSRSGAHREVDLRLPTKAHGSPPLPTGDGGVLLTSGNVALWLRRDLSERARAVVTEPLRSTVLRNGRALLTTERGTVFEWAPEGTPRRLGSFNGTVASGVALSSPRHLLAVVDGKDLVDLNLVNDTRHVRVRSAQPLEGPPTVLPSGLAFVTTQDGLLLGFDRAGREAVRVALEPIGAQGDPALPSGFGGSPPLIADSQRRVAFVRPGIDVGVVDPKGRIVSAEGGSCLDPESLVVGGPKLLVLTCSSGQVFAIRGK